MITEKGNLFSATLVAGKGNFFHRQRGFGEFACARAGEACGKTEDKEGYNKGPVFHRSLIGRWVAVDEYLAMTAIIVFITAV